MYHHPFGMLIFIEHHNEKYRMTQYYLPLDARILA